MKLVAGVATFIGNELRSLWCDMPPLLQGFVVTVIYYSTLNTIANFFASLSQ